MKTDLAGRRIADRYLLQDELATGGMATVYRARDETLGRSVAVKVLHGDLAEDEQFLERFRLEGVATARLSHPAIVRVFDAGVEDDVCFIVLELFECHTLADMLGGGPLEPDQACRVARRVSDALAHAHAAGIVHRDIKPANILIGFDGTVKVTDFGIAKAAFASGDLSTTGKLLGTAKYLAPEQVSGGQVDGRADIYALGVVLYEMLTGRPPFDAPTDLAAATMRLTKDPAPLRSIRAGIPADAETVAMRALNRDPAQRFQTAEEMGGALDHLTGEPHAPPPEAPVMEPVGSRRPSRWRRVLVTGLVIVGLGALGVAGAVIAGSLLSGGRNGDLGGGVTDLAQGRIEIVSADDFDPYGDNHAESPDEVPLAFDRDDGTFWETEHYTTPDLGGAKPGVGILFDLGDGHDIARVRIDTSAPGWTFEVRVSDEVPTGPEDAREVTGGTMDQDATVLPLNTDGRYVLLWITSLAPSADGGGKFAATVSEVRFRGSP